MRLQPNTPVIVRTNEIIGRSRATRGQGACGDQRVGLTGRSRDAARRMAPLALSDGRTSHMRRKPRGGLKSEIPKLSVT